ncbi:ABC transporter ATP-binding protein [Paenibacillus beijingensis]|uniref:ABC transporter ATP-binding protein n=1 Tax=Paenibacillus beijingensis TaxID=1126833 RepID=A0A0D5NIA9_9BACL|nr:ABC transporter ATP-binding protein [Paenibacillus beijingensis]AJY74643.1 ABC transporter ATP-binding protein [Paenibacillus beijingensis]
MSTFSFMKRLIMYRPGLYAANMLAWTLIHMAPLVPGLVTKAFFDQLEGSAPVKYGTWSIIALLVGAALGRVMLIVVGFMTDVHARFRISMLLRRNMLEHVLKEPGARAIPCSPGEAISQFRDDVDQTEEAVSWSVDVLGMLGFAAAASYILIRIDAQMTLLVFVPLIVVVASAQIATARLQKYRAASRESTAKVTGAISEMFANVTAIQVAGAEKRVIERFKRLNEERRRTMVKDRLMGEALTSVFTNSVNLGTGLILLLAGYKMRGGSFTVGDLSLFVYYLTFVTQLISNVGKFMTYYKQMTVGFSRLTAMLQGAPASVLTGPKPLHLRGRASGKPGAAGASVEPGGAEEAAAAGAIAGQAALAPAAPSAGSGTARIGGAASRAGATHTPEAAIAAAPERRLQKLEARGLTYLYPETGRGIRDVNLSLPRGSFTVITGMIGSGKTTLVRTLLGLLPASRGEIRWNGRIINDPADFFIPPHSAYTAQIPRLYSDKLRDNILLGYPELGGNLDRAIYSAVMEDDIQRLEHGLDTVIGPRGVKLSGGQAQRTAAARMLVREAELYVFDDLSSALDVETERKLWERMFAERGSATCLVVSHRKAALAHADRIIVMKDGAVEAEGTAAQLLAASDSFRRLWYGDEGERESVER